MMTERRKQTHEVCIDEAHLIGFQRTDDFHQTLGKYRRGPTNVQT